MSYLFVFDAGTDLNVSCVKHLILNKVLGDGLLDLASEYVPEVFSAIWAIILRKIKKQTAN